MGQNNNDSGTDEMGFKSKFKVTIGKDLFADHHRFIKVRGGEIMHLRNLLVISQTRKK